MKLSEPNRKRTVGYGNIFKPYTAFSVLFDHIIRQFVHPTVSEIDKADIIVFFTAHLNTYSPLIGCCKYIGSVPITKDTASVVKLKGIEPQRIGGAIIAAHSS